MNEQEIFAQFDKIAGKTTPTPTTTPTPGVQSLGDRIRERGKQALIKQKDTESAERTGATFPAETGGGIKSIPGEVAKTVGNIPSSGAELVKGVGSAVMHPIETVKTLGKTALGGVQKLIPGEQKQEKNFDALTGFLKERYGSLDAVHRTVVNDPVGFATDIMTLISGGELLLGKPLKTIDKLSDISKTGMIKAGEGIKELSTGMAGMTTGVGKEAFKQALEATPEFTKALRGKTDMTTILDDAVKGFKKIQEDRGTEYTKSLTAIKEQNPQLFSFKPLIDKVKELNKSYNVKLLEEGGYDFSRSPLVDSQKKVEGALKTIEDWAYKAETITEDRTVLGIDMLKQQLRKFREPTNPQLNSYIDSLANSAKDIIKDVPGYANMEANYAIKSDLLDELGRTLSLKDSATPDTAITKLNSLIRDNAEYRRTLADELKEATGKDILGEVAGKELSSKTPKGVAKVGTMLGAGYTMAFPKLIPVLAFSSPRLMGETFRLIGLTRQAIEPILDSINKVRIANKLPIIRIIDLSLSGDPSSE